MRWLAVIAALAFAVPALAYSPAGSVNDFAHVLSAGTVQSLDTELSAFDASTSNQIAVVTVPDMGGDYVEHYAEELFKQWGIGTKDKDNGALLLLSIQEHKIRIEVGYGLEGALPDSVAQSIINDMSPRLKAGDYDGAVTAAVQSIEAATKGEYSADAPKPGLDSDTVFGIIFFGFVVLQWCLAIMARSKSIWAGGILGGVVGVIAASIFGLWLTLGLALTTVLAVVGILLDLLVSNAYQSAKARGVTPPWWGGGTGGSGGSFGGFGGGSSGGGGASGGW